MSLPQKDLAKLPELSDLKDVLKNRLDALIVCLSNSWGGLEQVAASDALSVAAQGLKVRVLVLEGSPIHKHLKTEKSVLLYPIDFKPRNFLDFKLRAELRKFILDGVNLIHTHQTTLLSSLSPWLWRESQVALLASRHIMSNHDKRNLFHRMIYSRVDFLIVMSLAMRQNVLETHSIRENRVKVMNLGLDFEVFDPEKIDPKIQRKNWGVKDDTLVIGLVGRIDPAKGQSTFIRAAAGLMKYGDLKDRLKFVIVGEETLGSTKGYLEELKQMVKEFHLGDLVHFAGFQQNIAEVMRGFDIFTMPSRREAFGLVAIEALAMRCPIIVSGAGSADEIIGRDVDQPWGLKVRPEDAYDLQKQLLTLIENPDLRKEMGDRGRKYVMKYYDRKVRLRRTLELYDRALRRRGNGI